MMKKLLLLPALLLLLASCTSDSADLGIIGGADGPTAIVVGSQVDETEVFVEMPALDGIPTPPGTFETGWISDNSMLYVEMSGVSDDSDFHYYIGTVLSEAGFHAVWEQVGEKVEGQSHRDRYTRCEDSERSILLTWTDDTLTMTVTEK